MLKFLKCLTRVVSLYIFEKQKELAMKKNTFWMLLSILVGGLVLFVNFKINVGINKLSDVSLENVEAKASGEGGGATLYPQHITFLSDEKCTFTMVHGGETVQLTGYVVGCVQDTEHTCVSGCFL